MSAGRSILDRVRAACLAGRPLAPEDGVALAKAIEEASRGTRSIDAALGLASAPAAPEDRADHLIAEALTALDKLADSGDRACRRAAAVVRGLHGAGGRKPLPDEDALARIMALRAAGQGRSAVGKVARSMATDPAEVHAIAQRLREKLRKLNAAN